jgi:hypothetical protein
MRLTGSFWLSSDLAATKEVRMTTSRMLVLMLLVVVITSLPIFTAQAHASGFDVASWWAQYVCESYLWCD